MTASGADADAVAAEREAARQVLAFTYSTPAYAPTLEHYGWQHTGAALRRRARSGDWAGLAAEIDDAMLDVLVPSAPFSGVARELLRRYAGVADGISLRMPQDPTQDDTFRAVVSALRAG